MYGFSSFYWDVAELAEADRRAVATLNTASPPLPSAGYATHDPDGLLAAYRTLLHSADVRARGVALDQYTYAQAQHRWGVDNPMTRFDDEVLAQARALLAVTPEPTDPLAAQPQVTACWNSALGVLAFLTDDTAADLPRIIEVLDSAFPLDVLDVYSFWALEVRLVDADEPTCARVGEWLAATFTDERLPIQVRIAAVGVFGDDRFAARLGQRGTIAGLLDHPEIRLAIQAAWVLAGIDSGHAEVVRRAVAGWPDDAPYPADEVREILAIADELARARAALAAPGGEAAPVDAGAVVAALEALAEHGDASDVPGLLALLDNENLAGAVAEYPAAAFGSALNQCLRTAAEPTIRHVAARLAAVLTDARLPSTVRVLAIRPFWSGVLQATQPVALTRLLDHDDLRLSTAAARALADRAGSEQRVRRSEARWPDDAPYPASEVRTILADMDALAAARDVVARAADPFADPPVDAASLLDAVDMVLQNGEDVDGPRLLALLDGGGIAVVLSRSDRAHAGKLAGRLRSALRWRLPDGANDPRYATAVEQLATLAQPLDGSIDVH
jgi:hypothetical protein